MDTVDIVFKINIIMVFTPTIYANYAYNATFPLETS